MYFSLKKFFGLDKPGEYINEVEANTTGQNVGQSTGTDKGAAAPAVNKDGNEAFVPDINFNQLFCKCMNNALDELYYSIKAAGLDCLDRDIYNLTVLLEDCDYDHVMLSFQDQAPEIYATCNTEEREELIREIVTTSRKKFLEEYGRIVDFLEGEVA